MFRSFLFASMLLPLFSFAVSPVTAQPLMKAGSSVVKIGIDSDNNPGTGCDFDPGSGIIQPGVELVLEVTLDSSVVPPVIQATRLMECTGTGFSTGISLGNGPLGLNNGLDGGDVIEVAIPLEALGTTQNILISAAATGSFGQDVTQSQVYGFSVLLPTLGTWALLIFIALLVVAGIIFMRRNNQLDKMGPMALLLILGFLLVGFTDRLIQLDGQVDDWAGIQPFIIDPAGDAGDPDISDAADILAVFVCPYQDNLYMRIDVADLENDAPLAIDDEADTSEETPVNIDVLANDSDPDGDAFGIISVTQPFGGSVTIDAARGGSAQTLTYTPNVDNKGVDTFTYTIEDSIGTQATATVTVTISGTNDPPTAVDDAFTVAEDAVDEILDVLANDSTDPDTGETISVTNVGVPNQGGSVTISNAGADLTYSPAADFSGTETFTYTITDSNGGTASATVTITVPNENDPPVAVDDTADTTEDTPVNIDVLANDSDADGDTFSIVSVTQPFGGNVTIDAARGDSAQTLTYTPNMDNKGVDTFTYTIEDTNGAQDTATVTVTIVGSNDPPTAVDDTFTVDEDSVDQVLNAMANDSTAPDTGETISITAVGVPDQGGSVVISNAGADLTYSPAADFFGTETFTYTITDSNGGMASATVTVTVNNLNDPPTATDDAFTVDEDSVDNALSVLDNDSFAPDSGETLTITATGATNNGGSVSISGGGTGLTYSPAADFFGTETFTYTIEDGNGGSDSATVTVTVTSVDDPVVAVDDSLTTDEDNSATTADVLSNDTAGDGGLFVASVDAFSVAGAAISDNGNGTFDFDPSGVAAFQALDDGESTNDSFDYTAEDGDGDTDTATVNVTVTGVNDAPIADPGSESTTAGGMVVITLTASDVDVENLTFAVETAPSNGSLGAITPVTATSAQVTYTHDGGLTTTDSFTFTANDGSVDSAPATVSLTINDAPVAVDDGSVGSPFVVQRDSFLDIDVAANDTDAQGNGTIDLTSVVPTNGTRGTTAAAGGGLVTYTATAAQIGTDTFTYTIDDDSGATSNSAMVYVVINDPPVADDDMVAISEGNSEIISVLTGDTDSDDSIDVTSVQIIADVPGGEGTTSVNPDGTVTYDPGLFTGTTSFTYTVDDTRGGTSNTATVTIDVSPAPMATADAYNVFGHTTVSVPASIGLLANDTDDGTITATAGTFATANGGSITINADGSFSYTSPGPGAAAAPVIGNTDTYTYEIEDDVMGSDTAVITFTYEKVVWFVDNTNGSGTDDGSMADPFDTLAEAEAAADVNETIFIYSGDGSSTGQDTGITLQSGQELFGEPAGLSVDVDGMGAGAAIELIAAGATRPVIANTGTDVIQLGDSNTIEGLELQPNGAYAIIGEAAPLKMKRNKPLAHKADRELRRHDTDTWHGRERYETEREYVRSSQRGAMKAGETRRARAPHAKFGGNTTITNMVVTGQDITAGGILIYNQTGTISFSDITLNGFAGNNGSAFDYFENTADLTVSNLSINDWFDSFYMDTNTGVHTITDISVSTTDGYGIAVYDTDSIVFTGTNTISDQNYGGLDLNGVVVGAAGITFDTITSSDGDFGIYSEAVSGGSITFTGAVQVTNVLGDGVNFVDSSSDITFNSMLTIDMTGDDGLDLTELTGTVSFQGISISNSSDDGIDIQDSYETSITFPQNITITSCADSGIELNGPNLGAPTGTVTFSGTVDIDNVGFAGVNLLDFLPGVSFNIVDVDGAQGGVIFEDAVITAGETVTFTQLDATPGDPLGVGLGMAFSEGRIDVDGGTLSGVDGEVVGFIDSAVNLTYTGTVSQTTSAQPLVLMDVDDASTALFESGSALQDTAGAGFQFFSAHGTYTFEGTNSVSGNEDEGMNIGATSTGTFTFNSSVVLNTGSGDAFTAVAGNTATVNFNAGLDIDTTTGTGFQAFGGTFNIVDPAVGDNTVNVTGAAANVLVMTDATVGGSNVTFTSITGAVAVTNEGLNLENLTGGTFNGGTVTLAGSGAEGIRIAGCDNNFTFSQADISGTVTAAIDSNTNTGSITFDDVAINVTGLGISGLGSGTLNIDTGDANNASIQTTADTMNMVGHALNVNLTTLSTSSGAAARGLRLDTCSGSLTVDTGVFSATTSGIEITSSAAGTFTFDAVDIDVSAGTGLLLTSAGTVNIDTDDSAVTDLDAAGGPAVDIDDTIINIRIDSVSSSNSTGLGFDLSNIPLTTTGFNAGSTTIDNPTGIGIRLDDLLAGSFLFGNTLISNRNATGIFIQDHQATTVTFGDVDIANPNNAGGNAVHVGISGGGTSSGAIQLDSLDASDTNVTVNRADGGGDGVPDNETFDGNGVFIADHDGSFTITGTGTQGDGGTIEDIEGDGISLIRSGNLSLNEVTINNIGTSNQAVATVDNAGIYGIDIGGNITIVDSTISRFQDGNAAGTNSRGIYIRNDNADFTEIRVTDTTFFNDNLLLGDDAILVETFNTVNGSVVVESLSAVGNIANRSEFYQLSGMGVQILQNGGGTLTTSITNSLFRDAIAVGGFGGIEVSSAGSGVMSADIDGCTLTSLFSGGVNNGGMITLSAGGTVDYDATVNSCTLTDSSGRGGVRAVTTDSIGELVTDFDITITNNVMDDLDREAISLFLQGDGVPAASGRTIDIVVSDNLIGQVTPVPVSGREGLEFRALGSEKIVNFLLQDNLITSFANSTSDETVDIDVEDNATVNATILGNTLALSGTSTSNPNSMEITTEDAGSTICLDMNSDNTNPNSVDDGYLLTRTAGIFNIEDITAGPSDTDVKNFLEARNTGTVTASGAGSFGTCNQNP